MRRARCVLDDVAEGNVNPIGNTVSEIIASAGGDAITDPDAGAVEGIAVIGVDDSNGTWEYSTDAGASWTSFVTSGVANGAADDTAAVLLAATDKVRFSPGASYTGSAGDLTFRAWDQTSGSNGDVGVDASATGGTSAFSDDTETATLSVNGVVGVATAVPPAQLLDEDVALVFSSGNGNAITVSDGTGSDASLRVTLAVTDGTLTLSGTAGLTFVAGADGSATMTIVGLESAINASVGRAHLFARRGSGTARKVCWWRPGWQRCRWPITASTIRWTRVTTTAPEAPTTASRCSPIHWWIRSGATFWSSTARATTCRLPGCSANPPT